MDKAISDAEFQEKLMSYLRLYCEVQVWRATKWNGVDFWQTPEDILAIAEAIYQSKADLVIESGIHVGGGLEFYSTVLSSNPMGYVVGVDVNIEAARAVEAQHPGRMKLISGDSAAAKTVEAVRSMIGGRRTLVILDSNHTAGHVAKELELYAPMVSPGSYLIVMDGIIKFLVGTYQIPADAATNNPDAAIERFLPSHPEFTRDYTKNRFGLTFAPGGFLRKKAMV